MLTRQVKPLLVLPLANLLSIPRPFEKRTKLTYALMFFIKRHESWKICLFPFRCAGQIGLGLWRAITIHPTAVSDCSKWLSLLYNSHRGRNDSEQQGCSSYDTWRISILYWYLSAYRPWHHNQPQRMLLGCSNWSDFRRTHYVRKTFQSGTTTPNWHRAFCLRFRATAWRMSVLLVLVTATY